MIKTERKYQEALKFVEALFDDPPAQYTPLGDVFDSLCKHISAYEDEHYMIDRA